MFVVRVHGSSGVTTGTLCRDTRVCGGTPPGCVGAHHRGVRDDTTTTTRVATTGRVGCARGYAQSSRRLGAWILRMGGNACHDTRVPIAILSGVVFITPAKVLLSFSRVRRRLSD